MPTRDPHAPTAAKRIARVVIVVGGIVLAGSRALVPSAEPPSALRVDLHKDHLVSANQIDRIVHYTPPSPGSEILDSQWIGQGLEVAIRSTGPRVVVVLDAKGRSSVTRLQGSGAAWLKLPDRNDPAPPFTVTVLSARGPSMVVDSRSVQLVSSDAADDRL